MINYYVKVNEGCLYFVKVILKIVDFNNFDILFILLRKVLVIVVCSEEYVFCYFFCEDRWCKMGDSLGLWLYYL